MWKCWLPFLLSCCSYRNTKTELTNNPTRAPSRLLLLKIWVPRTRCSPKPCKQLKILNHTERFEFLRIKSNSLCIEFPMCRIPYVSNSLCVGTHCHINEQDEDCEQNRHHGLEKKPQNITDYGRQKRGQNTEDQWHNDEACQAASHCCHPQPLS